MTNTDVKVHTNIRELILKVKDGTKPISSIGLVDPRLFKRDNRLYAYLDPISLLWRVKYAMGGLPEELKQNWTKFSYLLDYIKVYYAKRNVEVSEVIDIKDATAA